VAFCFYDRRLLNGFEDTDQDVVSRLEKDVETALRETLLEGITCLRHPWDRRPHEDVRVFIFIDRLADLNGGFRAELFHKQGKLCQDAIQTSVHPEGRLICSHDW